MVRPRACAPDGRPVAARPPPRSERVSWRDLYARQGHLHVLDDPDPSLDETTLILCDDTEEEEVYLYMDSVLRACQLALQDGVTYVVCVEPGPHDISIRDALVSLRWWILQHSGVYPKAIAADMRWIADHLWAALGQEDDARRVSRLCREMLAFLSPSSM
jgi:hypothetical protein